MVLDIRQLNSEPEPKAPRAGHIAEPSASDHLDELLQQAAADPSPAARARAVEQLRHIMPSPKGIEALWKILAADGDPRRRVAAQVLGYHRSWLSSQSSLRRLLERVRQERDPAVGAALVWCLRQRDEIQEFLLHENAHLAREATLGLPLNRQTLPGLLQALLAGREAEIERILLHKLHHIHPSLVRDLVDHLLQREWGSGAERLAPLFECVPQVPLFEIFLEEQHLATWNPQQGLEEASVSRNWHQLARIAAQVLGRTPGIELLRFLISRSGEDEGFARRHAAFLRSVLHSVDAHLGSELLTHLERLTFKASEDKVARLAQLLVEFSTKLEGQAGSQAMALFEEWKSRSTALKLKIYHLQQGLT